MSEMAEYTSRRLALVDATYESPLAPRPWPQLNALHAALGALAELAGRVAVLPALDCGGVLDGFLEPGRLPSRCFWHVHARRAPHWRRAASGVRCVFRATCGEAVAPPSELEAALQANSAAAAPTVRVDLSRFDAGGDAAAAAASSAAEAVRLLLDDLTGVPVVLLRLTLPEAPADGVQPPIDPAVLRRAHPGLERAASRFRDSCPELLDRSKTRRRECTNFC